MPPLFFFSRDTRSQPMLPHRRQRQPDATPNTHCRYSDEEKIARSFGARAESTEQEGHTMLLRAERGGGNTRSRPPEFAMTPYGALKLTRCPRVVA